MNANVQSKQAAEEIIDLNDLRIFAYVASFASFSLAAEALQIHKSSVSRSIARLEAMLQTPLIQRTTRKVLLTEAGTALQVHCVEMLSRINESIRFVGRLHSAPKAPTARSTPGLLAKAPALGLAERQSMRGLGSLGSRVGASRAARQHNARLAAAA